jgi:hypothetical protein
MIAEKLQKIIKNGFGEEISIQRNGHFTGCMSNADITNKISVAVWSMKNDKSGEGNWKGERKMKKENQGGSLKCLAESPSSALALEVCSINYVEIT